MSTAATCEETLPGEESRDGRAPAPNGVVAKTLGFVAIGRNEGERLEACLRSIQRHARGCPVVYVDSRSSDDSVAFAASLGIRVVEIDESGGLTAARARNEGLAALLEENPDLEFVQFLDGDCSLAPGWLEAAIAAFRHEDRIGVVSGRRRERFPDASIYNALIDIEWDTPVGEARAVLGDMCVKVKAIQEVGGFRPWIMAAEDDDLCLRVRGAGYKVLRIDHDMSEHDANLKRLSQWYRRAIRGGHGFAQVHHLHGGGPEHYFRRELLRAVVWGGLVPLSFLLLIALQSPWALAPAAAFVAVLVRTVIRTWRSGRSFELALAYGLLTFTGKIPEFLGALMYWRGRLRARHHELIEYK
ncbi:MAG: glycosyltransferase family A protein [Myxococcota bacterium]|nr:glycosyltransferase family A protein [Myxococcota bacterium]